MAKRRDMMTRTVQRTGGGRDFVRIPKGFARRLHTFANDGHTDNSAEYRPRGRRGVRARARLARIKANQTASARGTRQPAGGMSTNS